MMNSYGPNDTSGGYLAPEFDLPKDKDTFYDFISKRERETANIVNIKENAQYELSELQTAQQYYNTNTPTVNVPDNKRYTFRKVFDMVALNGGNLVHGSSPYGFPHGIDMIATPTRIYGTATTTSNLYLPLPYSSASSVNNNIEINMDSTKVNLIMGSAVADLKQAYIIFEYSKN